ncbi:RING-H2 finger protein ATL80-like [Solanum dulcamara]|uniref:RING-H2 finger protein ATL80-like n=1 Tax=Solanum dulcamara TaxID=45834 RepID=UPI002484DA3D|nr:RING-H2 finger protein ATL80-like [Solanum dulcamara]
MSRPVLRFLLSTASSSAPPAKSTTADPPSLASVEPDYVIIIAALLCALICIIGLISVARCAWLRRAGGATGGQSAQANKGVKKKVLQSLPKFRFDPSSTSTDSEEECAICLAEYTRGDEIKVLPQCGHGFHVQCIDTWLGSHSSCPSCRQILQTGRCQRCGEFSGNSNSGAQIQGRNCPT